MPPDGNTIQPMMSLCQSMEPTPDQAPIKTQGAQGQRNILKEVIENVISRIKTGKLCRTNHLVSSTTELQEGETKKGNL